MFATYEGSGVGLSWLLDNVGYINDVINMKGFCLRTALHWAAIHGRNHCYDILVQHGADKTCVDKYGRTPVQYKKW